MFSIKPKTSMEAIAKKFGTDSREALRESQERRENLEKTAAMNTGQEVYVQISGDSAYADIAEKDSEFGYTDRLIINVRMDIPDQVTTSIDPEIWDKMVQKTDLYHEMGHILWTDWESYEEILTGDGNGDFGIAEDHRQMFNGWWNKIEDAFTERMLVENYDIESELRVTNDNLLKANTPEKTMSLNAAASAALLEYKHPIGWIDKLLDENDGTYQFLTDEEREIFIDHIYPVIEDLVPTIISTSDSHKRNLLVYNLYKQIGIYFDESVKPGVTEDHSFNLPDDADNFGDGMGALADLSQKDVPTGSSNGAPVATPDEKVEVDMQHDYANQVQSEKESMDPDSQQDSVEEWKRVIDREYDDGTTFAMRVPNDPPNNGQFNPQTRQEAERLSQPLARDFRQRLRQQQKKQKQTKKQSGKVDSKRAHKSQQGDTNIFSRHSDPRDKDYNAVLILDRSGSMSTEITEAETATGALAFALEDIGVNIGQLSLSGGDILLEKDLPETVDDAEQKMFRDYNGGGTPLSEALGLARSRLEHEGGNQFVIVLTDGEPDHRERYRDELAKCDFPVLGVYVDSFGDFDEDHMNESAYFHQLELRKYDEALDGVRNMAKKVMF